VESEKIACTALIMDDNSPDGTAQVVTNFIKENQSIYLELELKVRPGKMGLSSAYKQGFEYLKNGVEYLLSMDADLSHDPKYIPNFLNEAKKGYDLVIGSRYVNGGGVVNWGPVRKFISRFGSFYAGLILGGKINDYTGGYNFYKSSLFNSLDINRIQAQGYLFQIEMKYSFFKMGKKITEIPIIFHDRVDGKSKLSKSIVFEAFFGVPKLKFKKF